LVIKPREEDLTPGTVKPAQVSLVEPVAYQLQLGISERLIKRVKHGRFVLIPISDETRGHGTHSIPAIWGKYLRELLAQSEKPAS
jgi:hypothetical protein